MRLIYHNRYTEHIQNRFHPESPERLRAIVDALKQHGLFTDVHTPNPNDAADILGGSGDIRAVAELVHEPTYIDYVRDAPEGYLDPDTYKRPETYDIAMLAMYGGVWGAKYAYENGVHVMNLLRPPGHHAGRDYSGGFCYFNNIAVSAEFLIRHLGAKRVAIIDIDVHHGNGTWDIFRERCDVLYISSHQWGIYPGTGSTTTIGDGEGRGYTVSIPFLSGTGDSSYALALDRIITPILRQYQPHALLISLGIDAHYRDPLASLTLSSKGYVDLTHSLLNLADELCDGRCALFLEGGYDLEALAEVVAGIVARDRGIDIETIHNEVRDEDEMGGEVVDEVRDVLAGYWSL